MNAEKDQNEALNKTDVSKSVFSTLLKKMEKTHSSYILAKGSVEEFFSKYVDFDFSIDDMPGDGFLLLDYENSRVATIEKCFEIITKNGILTQDDMKTISI